ncbi:hypothetical protein D3C73_1124860 [compost metagenome]
MQQCGKIPAIVNNQIRFALQRLDIQCFELFGRGIIFGKYGNAVFDKCRTHIVLRRQRVGAGNCHLSPAGLYHFSQIGGFGFQMQRNRHLQPLERLLGFKLFTDAVQHRHMLADPVDFEMPLGC